MGFVVLLILFGGMWLLLIRPQQQRLRAQRQLVASLGVGDEVVTAGGVVARIVRLDDQEAALEVAPGVVVTFLRAAISRRLEPGERGEHGEQADAGIDSAGIDNAGIGGAGASSAGASSASDGELGAGPTTDGATGPTGPSATGPTAPSASAPTGATPTGAATTTGAAGPTSSTPAGAPTPTAAANETDEGAGA
jgi:preprotein translocase subunit YajC